MSVYRTIGPLFKFFDVYRYIRMRESSLVESQTVSALVEEKRQARSDMFKERLGKITFYYVID